MAKVQILQERIKELFDWDFAEAETPDGTPLRFTIDQQIWVLRKIQMILNSLTDLAEALKIETSIPEVHSKVTGQDFVD